MPAGRRTASGGARSPVSSTAGRWSTAAPRSGSSAQAATSAAAAASAATIDLVAATDRSSPAASGTHPVGTGRHWRGFVVDERDRERARLLGGPLHLDDVGALARLRDGDGHRALEPQRPAIDGGDRGSDRGAGQAEADLDQVFEIERRMVGTAAPDRHHDMRVAGPQRRRKLPQGRPVAIELRRDHPRDLVDLRRHEGRSRHPNAFRSPDPR